MSTGYTSSEVRFGDWIGEGFRMFLEQWQVWGLQSLVVYAAVFALMIVGFVCFFGLALLIGSSMQEATPLLFLMFFPLFFILIAVSSVLGCGMYKTAFKQLTGGEIAVADLFSGMECVVPVLLATLCHSVLVLIGLAFCIIPGLIIAGLLYFTTPLIIQARLGVFDAMRESKEVIQRNLLMFMLFAFVVGLIAQSGQYLCYVGLLATFPLQFTMGVIAYRDCFGVPGARSFQPPKPNAAPYGPPPGWPPGAPPPGWPPSAPPPGWPPSAVPPEPVFCPSCQAALPPGARFCHACGHGTTSQ